MAVAAITAFAMGGTNDADITGPGAESKMQGVKITNKKSGTEQWSLGADSIVMPNGGDMASLQAVTVGIPTLGMNVKSPSGSFNLTSRDLLLDGGVIAIAERFTISSSSVRLEQKEGILKGDDSVVIKGQGFTIEGTGFEALKDNRVRLKNDVRAIFH